VQNLPQNSVALNIQLEDKRLISKVYFIIKKLI
jgi:hypothetical protein